MPRPVVELWELLRYWSYAAALRPASGPRYAPRQVAMASAIDAVIVDVGATVIDVVADTDADGGTGAGGV